MSELEGQETQATEQVVEKVIERVVYVEKEEKPQAPKPKTNGFGIASLVISIIGLVLGFISICIGGWGFALCFISLILAIVGLCMKGASKGQAIAGLVMSIIGAILGLIFMLAIGAGVLAPQMIKYTEKSQISSDLQYCDTVRTAIMTSMMDPMVINEDMYTVEMFRDGDEHRLTEIKTNTAFGKSMEDILGVSPSEFESNLKQSNAIYFTINGNQVDVYSR